MLLTENGGAADGCVACDGRLRVRGAEKLAFHD